MQPQNALARSGVSLDLGQLGSNFDADTLKRVQAARAAGVPEAQIQREASQYQAKKSGQATLATNSQPQPQQNNSLLKTLAPLIGSIGGGLLGIPLGPAGVIGLGAAGGAAGSALTGGSGGDILKEGALGAVGGLFPMAKLGKVAQLAGRTGAEAAGQAATKGGEGLLERGASYLAEKSLRPSPGQFTDLKGIVGSPGRFILKEGMEGKSPEAIKAAIKPIQQQFTNLAEKEGVNIDPADIWIKLKTEQMQLAGTTGKLAQTKANALEDAILSFEKKYGNQAIVPIKEINQEAVRVGNLVKDFDTAGVERSADRVLRDAYRTSIQEAVDQAGLQSPGGQSLKELGKRLQSLYELEGVATKQEGLGKGSQIAGITGLLGMIAGGPVGGLGGAAAGFAATKLSQNPKVLAFMARNAERLAQSKVPGAAQAVGKQSLGQTGSRMLLGGGLPQPQTSETSPTSSIPQPQVNLASNSLTTQLASQPLTEQGVQSMQPAVGQADQIRQAFGILALMKAKNASDYKTVADLLTPAQGKPLTAEQQKIKANAESGLKALTTVQQELQTNPNSALQAAIPGSPGARVFATARREIADVLTRLRTGAALNREEQKFYEEQMIQPFDSQRTIEYKMNLFNQLFTRLAYGQVPATSESSIPMPQNQSF